MAGRASAFSVLGLDPGADAAAIDGAYKRLIKQHHPDRDGGDSDRAAEIIRAYRELRGGRAASDPLEFNEFLDRRPRRPRWPIAALVAGAALGGAMLVMGPSVPLSASFWAAGARLPSRDGAARTPADPIGGELHDKAIDGAVRDAVRLYRTKDEMALAGASRDCQRRFRDDPGTGMLDRCAAFDDAVVGLQDRDPLRDTGPFAPLAVTGRQWSAASVLSDDSLAIDSRLDQIRLKVELALVPQVPPIAPAMEVGNSG
jgi:DnaJ domain